MRHQRQNFQENAPENILRHAGWMAPAKRHPNLRQRLRHQRYQIAMLLFLLGWISTPLSAQEFVCDVTINSRQITESGFEYISELESEMESYINENRWMQTRVEEIERILCQFQVILTSASSSNYSFTAEVIISVRRPIWDTMQQTSLVLLSDNNWQFSYPRSKSLIRDDLQFDNLTSFVDFYVYMMLGFDYDSFAELGGDEFYTKALNIFELGQSSGSAGWGRSIGAQRNRFGLISDITNPGFNDLRKAFYLYHRKGLDLFTTSQTEAVQNAFDALKLIEEAKRTASNPYLFDIFFDTKYNEIVALFLEAEPELKNEAYNLLVKVNPSHTSAYDALQR